MIKRGWQRKLDKLKARVRRVAVNFDDLPLSDRDRELINEARKGESTQWSMQDPPPGVSEALRRFNAMDQEHDFSALVKGCRVTLSLNAAHKAGELRRWWALGISWANGVPLPHVPAERFEEIRKYLGAPEEWIGRGRNAFHWAWPVEGEGWTLSEGEDT